MNVWVTWLNLVRVWRSCKIKSSAGRNAVYGQTILGTDRMIVQPISCWYVVLLNGNCFLRNSRPRHGFTGEIIFTSVAHGFLFSSNNFSFFSHGSNFFWAVYFFEIFIFWWLIGIFGRAVGWSYSFSTVFIMVVYWVIICNWDLALGNIGTFFVSRQKSKCCAQNYLLIHRYLKNWWKKKELKMLRKRWLGLIF